MVLSKELHHCIKLHMAESHLSESDYMLRFSLEDRIHWLGDSGCQSTSVGRARSCYCRGDILQWVDQRTVVCLLPGLHQAVSFQIQCKVWALRKVGGLERPPTPSCCKISKKFRLRTAGRLRRAGLDAGGVCLKCRAENPPPQCTESFNCNVRVRKDASM